MRGVVLFPVPAERNHDRLPIRGLPARCRHQLANGGREARLAPTVLFHNEESQKLALRDEITPALWAKVLFDLPSPGKIKEATLLWFVNQPPADSDAAWTILVNGHKIAHQQRVKRGS